MKKDNTITLDLYAVTFVGFTLLTLAGTLYNIDWAMYLSILFIWWVVAPLTIFNLAFMSIITDTLSEKIRTGDRNRNTSYTRIVMRFCLALVIAALLTWGRYYEAGMLCITCIIAMITIYKSKKQAIGA